MKTWNMPASFVSFLVTLACQSLHSTFLSPVNEPQHFGEMKMIYYKLTVPKYELHLLKSSSCNHFQKLMVFMLFFVP